MATLKATVREITGRDVKSLRREKKLPAVIYGKKAGARNLTIDRIPFEKLYREIGESTLVDLEIEGKEPIKVLIQDVQRDPVKDTPVHIDLYEVKMDEEINAAVVLNFVGEPKAVRELGGTLVKSLDEIEIRCLPANLLSEVDVDLSGLDEFDDSIYVRDIKMPEDVTVTTSGDIMVAKVAALRVEEEEAPVVADDEAAAVEGVEVEGEPASADEATAGEEKGEGEKKDEGGEKKAEGGEKKAE